MLQIHVQACSIPQWYSTFSSMTIRSIILPLPEAVVQYLHEDGITLPDLPPNVPVHPNDPRRPSTTDWSDDDDDDDDDDDEETDDDGNKAAAVVPHCFPEFEAQITHAIAKLGGDVFPKLDWSSPRDAVFLKGGDLKCDNVGDIFLLLKGSDFCSHDLTHAYAHCAPSSSSSVTAAATAAAASSSSRHLVLRRWCNLYPSHEFRCIVRHNALVGITQRHCDRYFQQLSNDIDILTNVIDMFHQDTFLPALLNSQHKTITKTFSDNLGKDYLYDVYVNRRHEVTLLDFNVNHPSSTDSKLFSWSELDNIDSEDEQEGKEDRLHSNSQQIDVRFVESQGEAVPSQLSAHRVPADFVGDPAQFMEEFVDAQRRGDFNDGNDDTKGR